MSRERAPTRALAVLVGVYLEDLGGRDADGRVTGSVLAWLDRIPWFYALGLRVYLLGLEYLALIVRGRRLSGLSAPQRRWFLERIAARLPAMDSVHKLLKSLTYLSWDGAA